MPELTIVVAQAGPSGFLLATSRETMLDDEIAWDLPYLGWFDQDLRPQRDEKYGGGPHAARILDLPLEAGKSWTYYDTKVTAERANLTVPEGQVAGWRIAGADAKRAVVVEYAESVGFVTSFEERSSSGRTAWSLRLKSQDTSDEWVWLKRNAEIVDSGLPKAPSRLDVTAKDDAVFAWATGSVGSRAFVVPPAQAPWAYETAGGTSVRTARLAPEPGTWIVSGVARPPDGFVYTQLHALEWIRP